MMSENEYCQDYASILNFANKILYYLVMQIKKFILEVIRLFIRVRTFIYRYNNTDAGCKYSKLKCDTCKMQN